MFYLKVNNPRYRIPLWAWVNGPKICLSGSILAAEAFEPRYAERMRELTQRVFPGSKCELVECDSRELIPETMRKVLNIA